ncbi:LuxR C-terminal-related transcriptional regulator [Amycolatopsis pithecellobii]|uniref:LuxR family transcriptional regulator n=1 Tax=Amycolatopsis pithecellobii TaxID=664692 RepID=A0A6N7YZG3_9PSEU|nr:LuxR C-terminal-related transcriptional regulator [Amycolatopsis pithecellobii]MTD53819.1 LuxR family transcriptional regulator [Amycolatopsis pithecellobii]
METRDLNRHLDAALTRLRQKTGVSVAFGGPVEANGTLLLERFVGPTAGVLSGLSVYLGEGLGGRVVAMGKTAVVNDYFATRAITHRYDQLIRVERLRALVASPVVVHRRPIAVIYGAYRSHEIVGGRVQDTITEEARSLEQETVVAATLAQAREGWTDADGEITSMREQIRAADAKLRRLLASVDNNEVCAALQQIIRTLTDAPGTDNPARGSLLTTRESDVVSLAGLGYSNARIAEALGLTVHTVKSYMKSAMAKLDAQSRLEAVVLARRAHLIP